MDAIKEVDHICIKYNVKSSKNQSISYIMDIIQVNCTLWQYFIGNTEFVNIITKILAYDLSEKTDLSENDKKWQT